MPERHGIAHEPKVDDLARAERIGRDAEDELRKYPGYAPARGERKSFQQSSSSEVHDAEVAANALREAHADLTAYTDSGAPFGHRPVEDFLLARADRIEREAADRKSNHRLGNSEGANRADA